MQFLAKKLLLPHSQPPSRAAATAAEAAAPLCPCTLPHSTRLPRPCCTCVHTHPSPPLGPYLNHGAVFSHRGRQRPLQVFADGGCQCNEGNGTQQAQPLGHYWHLPPPLLPLLKCRQLSCSTALCSCCPAGCAACAAACCCTTTSTSCCFCSSSSSCGGLCRPPRNPAWLPDTASCKPPAQLQLLSG